MKKIVLLVAASMLMLGCDKSDDSVSPADRNEALYGQWEYIAITSDTAVDINGDNTVNIDLYNTNEIRQCLKDNYNLLCITGESEKNAYSINENGSELWRSGCL